MDEWKGWEYGILDIIKTHGLQSFLASIMNLATEATNCMGDFLIKKILLDRDMRYDDKLLALLLQSGCQPSAATLADVKSCRDPDKIVLLVPFLERDDIYGYAARAVQLGNAVLLEVILRDNPRMELFFTPDRLRLIQLPNSMTFLLMDSLRSGSRNATEIASRGINREIPHFLLQAIQFQDEVTVDYLLWNGANPNLRGDIEMWPNITSSSVTPLFQAIITGNENIIKRLLHSGANPNISSTLALPKPYVPWPLSLPTTILEWVGWDLAAIDFALLSGSNIKILEALHNSGAEFEQEEGVTWFMALTRTRALGPEFRFVAESLYSKRKETMPRRRRQNRKNSSPHRNLAIEVRHGLNGTSYLFALKNSTTSNIFSKFPDIVTIILRAIQRIDQWSNWVYILEHVVEIDKDNGNMILQDVFTKLGPVLPWVDPFYPQAPLAAVVLAEEAKSYRLKIPMQLRATFLQNAIRAAWDGALDSHKLHELLIYILDRSDAYPETYEEKQAIGGRTLISEISMTLKARNLSITILLNPKPGTNSSFIIKPNSFHILQYFLYLGLLREETANAHGERTLLFQIVLSRTPHDNLTIEAAEKLIAAGASASGSFNDSSSLLIHAVAGHNTRLVRMMLDSKATKVLEEYGMVPLPGGHFSGCYTALQLAVYLGDIAMVNLLLEYGADPNSPPYLPGALGGTALEIAIQMSSSNIAEVLKKRGAYLTPTIELGGLTPKTVTNFDISKSGATTPIFGSIASDPFAI
ncbi:hypothetical protein ABW19_dt0202763 [Dactylella cylindrospora]|nr:hypothetical protein ABW19_dt0202763 [Dactylella cylindrospora]